MSSSRILGLKVAGALLVSRDGEMLYHSISNMMKWVDWLLVMFDNEDEQTRKIVEWYQQQYPGQIKTADSGFPRATKEQEEKVGGLFERFRPIQAQLRDKVFQYMHNYVKEGGEIDLIFWPDSDEIFNVSLPEIVREFWKSDKKGLYAKHVSAYGNLNTMVFKTQPPDVIAYKYDPRLTSIPYRPWQIYDPLTRADLYPSPHTRIHLAYLTLEKRNWRTQTWRPDPFHDRDKKVWFLPKPLDQMTSPEIDAMRRSPHHALLI